MLPVASACAGLAFVIGPATSYALEPYSKEAGIASALVGFVQMAGGAALCLGGDGVTPAAKGQSGDSHADCVCFGLDGKAAPAKQVKSTISKLN